MNSKQSIKDRQDQIRANTVYIPVPPQPKYSNEVQNQMKIFEMKAKKFADETNDFTDYSKVFSQRIFDVSQWRVYGTETVKVVEVEPEKLSESSDFCVYSEESSESDLF
ncbi:Hypothetical_protein [Hexamita inflata]|uniref:Hypothetical_protein n=1 Tax=Hexamita inflata TaxID=28002 RepID=A0AA86R085_9EUKA|nr:Hypothetical protein HINF_LOCUS56914 [Hexamita inflata]